MFSPRILSAVPLGVWLALGSSTYAAAVDWPRDRIIELARVMTTTGRNLYEKAEYALPENNERAFYILKDIEKFQNAAGDFLFETLKDDFDTDRAMELFRPLHEAWQQLERSVHAMTPLERRFVDNAIRQLRWADEELLQEIQAVSLP